MKIVTKDMNYFGKGSTVKDCVIRAVSCATNFGYRFLMKKFGLEKQFNFQNGYGKGPGISKKELDKFAKKTGILKLIWGDEAYSDFLYQQGTTDAEDLEHFMENDLNEIISDAGKKNCKRFVMIVRPGNKKDAEMEESGHAIPLLFVDGQWTTYDVKTIKQITYSIPIYLYSVEKVATKDNPNNRKNEIAALRNEIEELNKIYREMSNLMKQSNQKK